MPRKRRKHRGTPFGLGPGHPGDARRLAVEISEESPGAPIGSEFYIQNPGGGLIPGATSAVAGSTVLGIPPSDLAFTIYGQAVPEPSSLVLFAIGGLGLAIYARWSRVTTLEGREKNGLNGPGQNA